MAEAFKKKRNIERATSFRLEIWYYFRDTDQLKYRNFKSVKSLNQWVVRNDIDSNYDMIIQRKLALIDDIWEPFTTIGKKIITLSSLISIVEDLKYSIDAK